VRHLPRLRLQRLLLTAARAVLYDAMKLLWEVIASRSVPA